MTESEIRIALAKIQGWTGPFSEINKDEIYGIAPGWEKSVGIDGGPVRHLVPQLTLDWMHKTEAALTGDCASGQRHFYIARLCNIVDAERHERMMFGFNLVNASATQKAEALLKALGKWRD